MSIALAIHNREGVLLATDGRWLALNQASKTLSYAFGSKIHWFRGRRAACAFVGLSPGGPQGPTATLIELEPWRLDRERETERGPWNFEGTVAQLYAELLGRHMDGMAWQRQEMPEYAATIDPTWSRPDLLAISYDSSTSAMVRYRNSLETFRPGQICAVGGWNEFRGALAVRAATDWSQIHTMKGARAVVIDLFRRYVRAFEASSEAAAILEAGRLLSVGLPLHIAMIGRSSIDAEVVS